MNTSSLAVILLTYDRFEYAKRTLESFMQHCSHAGALHLIIADDGSPKGYTDKLAKVAAKVGLFDSITITNAERGGYGRSYNLATQVAHQMADLVLPLEDDWELLRRFEVSDLAEILLEPGSPVGCIRMGYVGFTQPLRGMFETIAGRNVLMLDPFSPEPHVFAGHPRLETTAWQRGVGPWPEGIGAGATEYSVAQRLEARTGVAWPTELITTNGNLFAHIGTIQARDD